MKVLLLVQDDQRVILDKYYDAICQHGGAGVVLQRLPSAKQKNLRAYFQSIIVEEYDRIVLMLRFKYLLKQVRFLRSLPNLVIIEHDACQNFISTSKYFGKFSRFYRAIPWLRVIVSGYVVAQQLRDEGVDAVFLQKGYDSALLTNQQRERDIDAGFIGSTGSSVYSKRKAFLETLAVSESLQIVKTPSGQPYADTLNRIRFFVSCDIGLGEYMIKNFEALACGCVLFAWRQGQGEEEALGFRDMENIVLYSSEGELREKLARLRKDMSLAGSIARQGQLLAERQFSFDAIGEKIASAWIPALRNPTEHTIPWWKKIVC